MAIIEKLLKIIEKLLKTIDNLLTKSVSPYSHSAPTWRIRFIQQNRSGGVILHLLGTAKSKVATVVGSEIRRHCQIFNNFQ